MLTLGLRSGEYIVIGDNIVIKAVQVDNQVQLAIEAPRDMAILREAVYEQTIPHRSALSACRSGIGKSAPKPKQPLRLNKPNDF